jgi:hypothetical protein
MPVFSGWSVRPKQQESGTEIPEVFEEKLGGKAFLVYFLNGTRQM